MSRYTLPTPSHPQEPDGGMDWNSLADLLIQSPQADQYDYSFGEFSDTDSPYPQDEETQEDEPVDWLAIANQEDEEDDPDLSGSWVRELFETEPVRSRTSYSGFDQTPGSFANRPSLDSGVFQGIFRNEGARTGQPTNLNSSAMGRGQMIKGTRMAMYRKLGISPSQHEEAEQRFRTDPDFEMRVMNAYREDLDARIPSGIQGDRRQYMIAKGWYTGDPFYDDNKVPGKSAGNKMTAGEYARRAIQYHQQGGVTSLFGASPISRPRPGYRGQNLSMENLMDPMWSQEPKAPEPVYQDQTVMQINRTGNYNLPAGFNLANAGMMGITGAANWISHQKQNAYDQERMQWQSDHYRPGRTNFGLSGIGNVPYAQQGLKPSKYQLESPPITQPADRQDRGWKDRVAEYVYSRIQPSDTDDWRNFIRLMNPAPHLGGNRFMEGNTDDPYSEEAWARYLGLNPKPRYITPSGKRPPGSQAGPYYKLPDNFERDFTEGLRARKTVGKPEKHIAGGDNHLLGSLTSSRGYNDEESAYFDTSVSELLLHQKDNRDPTYRKQFIDLGDRQTGTGRGRVLGRFTAGQQPEKGTVSYQDRWDFPLTKPLEWAGIAKPFDFYNEVPLPELRKKGPSSRKK